MWANNKTIKAEKIHLERLRDISFYILCISRLYGALFSLTWERPVCEILDTSQPFINFDFKNYILSLYLFCVPECQLPTLKRPVITFIYILPNYTLEGLSYEVYNLSPGLEHCMPSLQRRT